MTYTELEKHLQESSVVTTTEMSGKELIAADMQQLREKKRKIKALDPDTQAAWKIIEMLRDRKGFKWWWDSGQVGGMDGECNDEIFAEIEKIIKSHPRPRD
jgi:hypothetical protein